MQVAVTLESIATERSAAANGDRLYVMLAGHIGTGRVVRVQPERLVSPDMTLAWVMRAGESRALRHRLHQWRLDDLEALQICCAFASRREGHYVDVLGIAGAVANAFQSPQAFLLPLVGGSPASEAIARQGDPPLGEVVIAATNIGGALTTTLYYGYAANSHGRSIVVEGTTTRLSLQLTGSDTCHAVVVSLVAD